MIPLSNRGPVFRNKLFMFFLYLRKKLHTNVFASFQGIFIITNMVPSNLAQQSLFNIRHLDKKRKIARKIMKIRQKRIAKVTI